MDADAMGTSKFINTSDFAVGLFAPHGHTEVDSVGDIIRLSTVGPFNIESVRAVNKARIALLERVAPKRPYAYLNAWSGSLLMSPECVSAYVDGFRDAYRQRFRAPVAIAWIAGTEVEGGNIMETFLGAPFEELGIAFQTFEQATQAERWVKDALKAARS